MSTSRRNIRNPIGFLSQDDIKQRILESLPSGSKDNIAKEARKIDLLEYAKAEEILSKEEIEASRPVKYTTIKTYLSQVVSEPEYVAKIQDYVRVHSLLFIRAIRLQNLMVHSLLGIPFGRRAMHDRRSYLWRTPANPSQCFSSYCYEELFQRKPSLELLKQCYLPERYANDNLHPCVRYWMETLGEHLQPLDWLGVMSKTGWYNFVNDHATSMRANIETMVRARLISMAKGYVLKLQWNVQGKILHRLLLKPWPNQQAMPTELRQDTIDVIHDIRKALGAEDKDYLNSVEELTKTNFDLYVHFIRFGIETKEILPMANYARKYAYLDNKIAEQLFGKPTSMKKRSKDAMEAGPSSPPSPNVLHHVFALSSERLNHKRKETRKLRRQKHQKGRFNGYKALSREVNIKSLSTDGVGVSLTTSRLLELPTYRRRIFTSEPPPLKPSEWKKKKYEKNRREDIRRPIFVGVDTGRAKLYTAAIDRGSNGTPSTLVFTRNNYYWEMGHLKRKTFEKNRRQSKPQVVEALAALSPAGQYYDIRGRLEVETQHKEVLIEDFVDSMDRAVWRMRGYRWKASSLDQAANRLIDASKTSLYGQRTVIAIGNANFPSGGKGEKSVPVKGMERALYKARDRRVKEARDRGHNNPITIVKVDEFRTTYTCCHCGEFNKAAPFPYSRTQRYPSRRLRLCIHCNEQADKLIDRDVNGARNILKVVFNEYYGLPRPLHLRRPQNA